MYINIKYNNTNKQKNKRFIATLYNENKNKIKTIYFGLKNYKIGTYIDHHNPILRKNYLARHMVREKWNEINPASLSAKILWGDSTDINDNIKQYLHDFNLLWVTND